MKNLDALFAEGIQKNGKDIINNISILIKMTDMYGPQNAAVVKIIEKIIAQVNGILLGQEGGITLKMSQKAFFIEDLRVKPPAGDMSKFDFLNAELEKRKIGVISFKTPLLSEDFIIFAYSLKNILDLSQLQNELEKKTVKSILISGYESSQKEEEIDLLDDNLIAQRSYISVFYLIKNIYGFFKIGQQMDLKALKRKIQILIDCILKEEKYLLGFIKYVDDDFLNYHVMNVTILSILLGKKIGLKKYSLGLLGLSASLHDIGKINIPLEIINKNTELTQEESMLYKKHPLFGVKVFLNLKKPNETSVISMLTSYEHHWNLDFSGYPVIKGKREANLFSQIIRIVDEYDILVFGKDDQRRSFSREEALKIIYNKSDKELDPVLVKSFISVFS